ncbi:MAG: ATP phosphoribosyltransferase [Paludibacteraceae bacterium]|nr:ATP phosphoribosyltransferase [Paludibacteraceae bacterium]
MLRIAIAPNAQFCESTIEILRQAGVKISSNNVSISRSREFPAEIFMLPYNEILHNVAAGIVDIGIVGEHHLINHRRDVETVRRFNFACCNLSLSLPLSTRYKGIEWFNGKKVATPFPDLLTQYFKEKNIKSQVVPISNVSSFIPELGVADAVFDLVITGSTLLQHNMREVELVMQTAPVLIAGKHMQIAQRMIFEELLMRIDAIVEARGKKQLTMLATNEVVDEIVRIISPEAVPTVALPMADGKHSFITIVTDESRVWDVLPRLKELGAMNIAVCNVEKLVR